MRHQELQSTPHDMTYNSSTCSTCISAKHHTSIVTHTHNGCVCLLEFNLLIILDISGWAQVIDKFITSNIFKIKSSRIITGMSKDIVVGIVGKFHSRKSGWRRCCLSVVSSLRRPGEERFDWFSRNQDRVVVKPIQIKMSNSRRSRKKDEPPADGENDLFSPVSKLKKALAEAKLAPRHSCVFSLHGPNIWHSS